MGKFVSSLNRHRDRPRGRNFSSNDFDIIVKVCDFVTPSKSAKKVIDKDTMERNVIKNPKWQEKLSDGKILGLFTHKGRQPKEQMQEIPYEDNIAISPYLCNYAKDVWIDGHTLYAGIDVFEDMQYGKILKDMLVRGMNVPVSMAVRATSDNQRFYVKDLLGIDFTFRPDLEAEVITVNFSNGVGIDGDEIEDLVCSACTNSIDDSEIDFSIGPVDEIYHFSYVPKSNEITLGSRFLSSYDNNYVNYSDTSVDESNNFSGYSKEYYVSPECIRVFNEMDIPIIRGETLVNGKLPVRVKIDEYEKPKKEYLESLGIVDPSITETGTDKSDELGRLGKADVVDPNIDIYYNDLLDNFSNDSKYNFSLVQYLQELKLEPHQVLKNRVYEVIRFLNMNNKETVLKVNDTLKAYIDTYVLKWIQDVLNHPEDNFNLMLGLRLSNYNIDRNSLIQLQRLLNRTKQSLLTTSIMPPNLQKDVNKSYQLVIQDLYNFINSKSTSGNVLK